MAPPAPSHCSRVWTLPGTTLTHKDVRQFAARLGVSRRVAERLLGEYRQRRGSLRLFSCSISKLLKGLPSDDIRGASAPLAGGGWPTYHISYGYLFN